MEPCLIADLRLFILSIHNVKQSYTSHWFRSNYPWKKDPLQNNMESSPKRRLTNSKKIQNEQNSMKQPIGQWNALIWILKINLQHVWNSCCCLMASNFLSFGALTMCKVLYRLTRWLWTHGSVIYCICIYLCQYFFCFCFYHSHILL